MVTKKLNLSVLNEEGQRDCMKIVERMGWCYDYIGENTYLVNVPIEDESLFYFLDNCF